jgi:hypothetical protein
MKKAALFILVIALAQGCKKTDTSNQVLAPENGAPPVTYNYNLSVINDKPEETTTSEKTIGDTLIIKINDVIKLKSMGSAIPKATEFKCKSGDKLYVYHNPGTVLYNNKNIIQSNKLILYPDGGVMSPISFNGCRCIGTYEGYLK